MTDHNGVSGSMEFAQAAKPLGLRAHPRRRRSTSRTSATSRCWSRTQTGWRNLCRIVTRAHVHDRDPHEPPPAVPLETLEEHAAGLVLPERLRAITASMTSRRCGGCSAAFGPDHLRVELQRPFQRHDRARNRALAQLAQRLGVPTVATGNVHAHARYARAAAGRVRRAPPPPDAGRVGAGAARQHRARARLAGGDGRALRGPCARAVEESGELADAAAVRPHAGPRLPLSGGGGPAGAAQARRAVLGAARGALPARPPTTPRRMRVSTEELRVIDALGLAGLLPPAPRPAGAGARGRGRGAGAGYGARAAAAGPRARLARCPRSSATSPASRTSTRSRTTCSSAASSTRSSTRCRTSIWTSRATCARS